MAIGIAETWYYLKYMLRWRTNCCFEGFHSVHFRILDVFSNSPPRCTPYMQYKSLPHVSAHLTPSSGRPYVFLIQNHCFYNALVRFVSQNITCASLLVYSIFAMIEIVFLHAVLWTYVLKDGNNSLSQSDMQKRIINRGF
jgi:hypothetical protein